MLCCCTEIPFAGLVCPFCQRDKTGDQQTQANQTGSDAPGTPANYCAWSGGRFVASAGRRRGQLFGASVEVRAWSWTCDRQIVEKGSAIYLSRIRILSSKVLSSSKGTKSRTPSVICTIDMPTIPANAPSVVFLIS